jgi:hypothetical protein
MKKILIALIVLIVSSKAHSQGCVVIRNIAGFGQFAQLGYDQSNKKWMISMSNRYYRSIQPFRDSDKIPLNPAPDKRNVNHNNTFNLSMIRLLDDGWAIGVDMPISANSLTTRAEHYSGDRHTTSAVGIGDIRVTLYKWLFKQGITRKGNIQAGLGIKLPTGAYGYQDYFYNNPNDKSAKMLAPVDPSVQLGDGGTGFTAEINAYYLLGNHFSFYGNFFYLMNPRDQNGVSTLKGHDPITNTDFNGPFADEATLTVNSVPDNYTMRAGANYSYHRFVGTVGARMEGVPVHDLVGDNHGLRRPGHVTSVELGTQYKMKSGFLFVFAPLAVSRVLHQSVPDKVQSMLQGKYESTAGRIPGATIIVGYSFLL